MPVFKALAQWERELQENDSAVPSFDFTDWWIEAGCMMMHVDGISVATWQEFDKMFSELLKN